MNEIENAIHSMQNLNLVISITESERNAVNLAIQALQEKTERDNPKPLTVEQFENICKEVHNGWWEEKKKQGVTDHPDMIPYEDLSESIKDYDRVTVRRVLDAMGIGYPSKPKEVVGSEWVPVEQGLPAVGVPVQVTYLSAFDDTTPFCDAIARVNPLGKWIWSIASTYAEVKIVAWKPLCKPYQPSECKGGV